MGKAAKGNYISKGYQDRIEISLGNISRDPNDKFAIVGMSYIPSTFKCELCGHEPCLYAFSVKNLETEIVITVGSECVKHFKAKGCNIDVAAGLKKRVKSVIRQMRRYMKNTLEQDEYKAMSKERKRELVIRLFMKHQAIEALKTDMDKKSFLSKEDVQRIIESCPETEPIQKELDLPEPPKEPTLEEQLASYNGRTLTDQEKKEKKRLQDKIRYQRNKTSHQTPVPMAASAQ
jgi:hypothetical protein